MVIINVKKQLNAFSMDISLRFSGGIVVITGANGGGKSTLLKIAAGLETPDEGCISIMGEVFFDESINLPPEKRRVGYLCQDVSLFPWLTVEKNISFGINKNTSKEKDGWLNQLYSSLDIGHLIGRYPNSLSGGEQQRVGLARALAPMPKILLLDEPFSAIDMEARPKMRLFLKDIQKKWNIPILLVTHDYAEASVLGDFIFELAHGKISARKEKTLFASLPAISY